MFQFTNLSVQKYGQLEKNRGKSEEYFWVQGSREWLGSTALKGVVLRHVMINIELGYSEVALDELTARLELMSQDDDYRAFIALADGKVVGFVGTFRGIAFEMKGFYLRVIALAVSLDYRNIGIGRSLIKHVEDYAGTLGITAFAVNSGLKRQNAHTFYEHCGFSKRTYGFGKDTSF